MNKIILLLMFISILCLSSAFGQTVSDWEFKCVGYTIVGYDDGPGFRMESLSLKSSAQNKLRFGGFDLPVKLYGWIDVGKSPAVREAYLEFYFNQRFRFWIGQITVPNIYRVPPPENSWLAFTPFDSLPNIFDRGVLVRGKFDLYPWVVFDNMSYMFAVFNGNGNEDDNNNYKDMFARLCFDHKLLNVYGNWTNGMQPDGNREVWNTGASATIPDSSVIAYYTYLDFDNGVEGWYAGFRLRQEFFTLYDRFGENFFSRHLEFVGHYMENQDGKELLFGMNMEIDNVRFRVNTVGYGENYKLKTDIVYRFKL